MKKYFGKIFKSNSGWILIIILLSIPATLPLIRPGFFHFSDEPHIVNLYEMIKAFMSGQLPPRWAPDMSWGYGYPLFNFYYPLPYYIGSLFYLFNHSLVLSLKWVFLLTIPLSGMTMYLWLKNHSTKLASLVGAVIYIYTPYRAVDLYVRGAVGECLAFVFVPLVFYITDKLLEKKSNRYLGLGALFIGLFFLSHNLAPLIFVPLAFVYGCVILFVKKDTGKFGKLIFMFALGFLISAYWSIPAFLEKNLLNDKTPFNYLDHFPFIKQLIYSPFRYGASLPGPNDDLSFQIGLVNIILILITCLFLIRKKLKKEEIPLSLFLITSFLFSLFLMNIRSDFLWRLFPLANYIQFPWRLLLVTTFASASMIIFIKNKYALLLYGLLAILINFNYFKPSGYFYPDDSYYLSKMLPCFKHSIGSSDCSTAEYKNYSEDYLLLPKWVKEKPTSVPEGVFTTPPINFKVIKEERVSDVSFITKFNGGTLYINKYYFPGWEIKVNGKPIMPGISEPYGNMSIDITEGLSQINVDWKETPLRLMSDIFTLLSLGLSVYLITLGDKKRI